MLYRTQFLTALLLTLGLAGASSAPPPEPRVKINSGVVEGTRVGQAAGVAAFKGIPYAAPPTRGLRWKPSHPVEPWRGVRAARELGPSCPQPPDLFPNFWRTVVSALDGDPSVIPPLGPTSEDCLFLNVWTSNLGGRTKQPVLVWIHGGGFVANRGGEEPAVLATEGAVVMTINYRLGVLGFLAHPALTKESPRGSSGNYGLLDQIEALRWVQRNIAEFGGDPNRVTVFGFSSGGAAVLQLLTSPVAQGLFHRAIAQSGGLGGPLRTLSAAEAQGQELAKRFGAVDGDPLAALRAADVETLRVATSTQSFGPVRDGWVLAQTFPGGGAERSREVPLIVGAATNEAVNRALRFPQSVPKDRAAYRALVEQAGQSWSDRLLAAYPAESDQAVPGAVLRYLTDRDFVCASRYVAAKRSSLTWVYLISAMPAPTPAGERLGSFHGADLRFLFNLTHGIPLGDTGRRVGEVMRRFWVRFAANGDPNDGGPPEWPRFQATKPQHLELGDVIRPATGEWLSRCNLFDEIWDARSRHDQ